MKNHENIKNKYISPKRNQDARYKNIKNGVIRKGVGYECNEMKHQISYKIKEKNKKSLWVVANENKKKINKNNVK